MPAGSRLVGTLQPGDVPKKMGCVQWVDGGGVGVGSRFSSAHGHRVRRSSFGSLTILCVKKRQEVSRIGETSRIHLVRRADTYGQKRVSTERNYCTWQKELDSLERSKRKSALLVPICIMLAPNANAPARFVPQGSQAEIGPIRPPSFTVCHRSGKRSRSHPTPST